MDGGQVIEAFCRLSLGGVGLGATWACLWLCLLPRRCQTCPTSSHLVYTFRSPGLVWGFVTIWIVGKIYKDVLMEITLTVARCSPRFEMENTKPILKKKGVLALTRPAPLCLCLVPL